MMIEKVRNIILHFNAALLPTDKRSMMHRFLPAVLLVSILYACANIGNPNGGPYDEVPPKFVSSKPGMNQLNFKGQKIEILFDEFISIEKPNENVIITPPQKQNPLIQAIGKKVKVELKDTLYEQTTYTIDFTSSIVDNNEKNALENFSFAFSTGDVLDTLQIKGILLNAKDLEPVQQMMVGIHRDLSDTAFTKTPFLRTSKTNDRGQFVIKNVALDSYRVFALDDKNRNFAYDKSNDEGLAFLDSLIIPSCKRALVADTIWKDSITVDTVMMVERTLFYPDDLVLWFFTDSVAPRQRMLRPERSKEHIITLKFNAPMDTFPNLTPINFEPTDSVWYVTQRGEDRESFAINYWILDSMIYKKDTVKIEVVYWKNNDSLPDLLDLQVDTLSVVYKEPPPTKKEAKSKRPAQSKRTLPGTPSDTAQVNPDAVRAIPLQIGISPSGSLNPYDVVTVMFNEPVMDVQKEHFVMEFAVDTLWEAVDFEFEADSTRAMTYLIKRPFKYEERYRVSVDSALLTSVYGHSNNPQSVQMTVKGQKEYGQLSIDISGLPFIKVRAIEAIKETGDVGETEEMEETGDAGETGEMEEAGKIGDTGETGDFRLRGNDMGESDSAVVVIQSSPSTVDSVRVTPAFIELLGKSGEQVRKAIVENGVARFKDVNPEKYYMRIILDANGNGRWDSGNYEERLQPETVYYYMKQIEIRQNWKHEETWDIGKSVLGQKPADLIKNKPKEAKKTKRDYKEESKPRKSNSTTPSIGGLKF